MNFTNTDGKVDTIYYNTFEATLAMLDVIVRFNKTPDAETVNQDHPLVKYMLDNGQNDLLIETEKVIDLFKLQVSNILENDIFYLKLIFGISTSLYFLSMILILIDFVVYHKKVKQIFRTVAVINPILIKTMRENLKTFSQALLINSTKNLIKLSELNKSSFIFETKQLSKNIVKYPSSHSNARLKIFIQHKLPRYASMILFIVIAVALSGSTYNKYTNATDVYFENNNYLTTASYNRYLYTFVIASNYYALADQYIGYIRNIPTIQAIPIINEMISSNDKILSVFTDQKGFKNDFLKTIFEDELCPYVLYFSFPGKDMKVECATLTKNYTYALIGVNLLVYGESKAISKILIANHTYANCKLLYSRFNNNVGPGTYVLGAANEVIFNTMKGYFDKIIPALNDELLTYFMIQLIISIIMTLALIYLLYNTGDEKIFGELFRVIPLEEIISNKSIKYLAVDIYGKKLNGLKQIKSSDIYKE